MASRRGGRRSPACSDQSFRRVLSRTGVASAGSAIVTLTAAFLNTLAPGLHTLTAVFEDGNNPQATFTVNAAGTLPAHATGAAVPGQAEQTPRTSDDAALPTALIAAIALASSLVAARTRKAA